MTNHPAAQKSRATGRMTPSRRQKVPARQHPTTLVPIGWQRGQPSRATLALAAANSIRQQRGQREQQAENVPCWARRVDKTEPWYGKGGDDNAGGAERDGRLPSACMTSIAAQQVMLNWRSVGRPDRIRPTGSTCMTAVDHK